MKTIWGLGVLLLTCGGVGATQLACSSGIDEGTGPVSGDHKMDDLIGSVPVTSKSLDGIGSIALVYDYGGGAGGGAGSAGAFNAGAPGSGGSGSSAGDPGIGGASLGGAPFGMGGTSLGGAPGSGGVGSTTSSLYLQCTGTLISKSSVLTSRSCAQLFEQTFYGYSKLKFAIGADATKASRLIDVVAVEYAPVLSNENGTFYPDIGVLHLGETVTDVASFSVNVLTDDLIGKPFAAVGYGNSDLRYASGSRRAGSLTLQGTSGPLYPLIFGSFEAFYAYVLSAGYYPSPYPGIGGGVSVNSAAPGEIPILGGAPGIGGAPGAGGSDVGGGGSWPSAGFGNAAAVGGGGGDWYREYLQQQYDNVQIAPTEAYFGGDSEAQPCGADQGGPIVRKVQNQVRVFGVFSHTPVGGCSHGGVYAKISAETKAFVDAAAQWKDPCTGFTGNGKCVGTTATRCSTSAEGPRRLVKFDCSLLNQVCVAPITSEVACTDK